MNQPQMDWFCSRCGFNNLIEWEVCQRCRYIHPFPPSAAIPTSKPASNSKTLLIVGAILIVLCGVCGLLGIIGNMLQETATLEKGITNKPSPSLTFQETVKNLRPSENLAKAKMLLKNKPSKEQIYQATTHLQAIPNSATEYKGAQSLIKISANLSAKIIAEEKREESRQAREREKRLDAGDPSRPEGKSRSSKRAIGGYYIRGPRGGCYYINSHGSKTYVDRSLCN